MFGLGHAFYSAEGPGVVTYLRYIGAAWGAHGNLRKHTAWDDIQGNLLLRSALYEPTHRGTNKQQLSQWQTEAVEVDSQLNLL